MASWPGSAAGMSWPRSRIPLRHAEIAALSGPAPARADRAGHPPGSHQPADTRRVTVHPADQGADVHCPVRPGQPDSWPARHPHRPVRWHAGRAAAARTRPDKGQRRRDHRAAHADRHHRRRSRRHPLDRRAPRLHHQNRAGPDTAGNHTDNRVRTEPGRASAGRAAGRHCSRGLRNGRRRGEGRWLPGASPPRRRAPAGVSQVKQPTSLV